MKKEQETMFIADPMAMQWKLKDRQDKQMTFEEKQKEYRDQITSLKEIDKRRS